MLVVEVIQGCMATARPGRRCRRAGKAAKETTEMRVHLQWQESICFAAREHYRAVWPRQDHKEDAKADIPSYVAFASSLWSCLGHTAL